MDDGVCPKCAGPVQVAGDTTRYHLCPKCGAVDPVPRMAKVFEGGGPLLGQAMTDTAAQSAEGWE